MWLSKLWQREPITEAVAVRKAVQLLRRKRRSVADPPDSLPADPYTLYVLGCDEIPDGDPVSEGGWHVVFTCHHWREVQPGACAVHVSRRTGRTRLVPIM